MYFNFLPIVCISDLTVTCIKLLLTYFLLGAKLNLNCARTASRKIAYCIYDKACHSRVVWLLKIYVYCMHTEKAQDLF